MLRDFDAPLTATVRPAPPVPAPAPVLAVQQSVTVTRAPSQSCGYLARPATEWGWEDVRDFVVHEIEVRYGTFPRDSRKEFGIFSRFAKTYGADAGLIARFAFEVCDGWWASAPISINRFCKASDVYFSDVILARLRDTAS